MARETRRQLLAVHGRFIAGGALFALLITIFDQAFGIGKGMISFENVLSMLAWFAFAVVATFSTLLVFFLARSRKQVVIINVTAPFGLLMAVWLLNVVTAPKYHGDEPELLGEAAIKAAPDCLGELTSWSWTEEDRLFATLHLVLTMPAANTVSLYASAHGSGNSTLLAQDSETSRALPSGRSRWDVSLARFQPGPPQAWLLTFKCEHPHLSISYSSGVHANDYSSVQHPLPPASSSPRERVFSAQDYDLFFWYNETSDAGLTRHTSFLMRGASNAQLDAVHEAEGRRPIEELPAQLAAMKGADVTRWDSEPPSSDEHRRVRALCDAAQVHLLESSQGRGFDPPARDAGSPSDAALGD